jgi:long-chain-fatty-acid--[acyl-carrier-protein] ligase
MTALFPLLIGLRVIFHPSPLDLQGIAHQAGAWEATVIATAPTFLKNFLQVATPEQLSKVRFFVVGAEKTPPDLIPAIEQKAPQASVIEGYGLTECSPVLTLSFNQQGVGKPLDNVEIKIVDSDTFAPCPSGTSGLILAKGPNVFAGYLDSDMQPFIEIGGEKWFATQDLGFLDPQGVLHLAGRKSRTVKIGGELISLPFIEDLLWKSLKNPALQIAVVGEDDARKGSHLILYTNQDLALDEVNQILRHSGASPLLKIKEVRRLPSLPLTAMGKIDYKKLGPS